MSTLGWVFDESSTNIVSAIKPAILSFQKSIQVIVNSIIAAQWTAEDYHMHKWIMSLPTRGWIQDGWAYLIVYDAQHPSKSKILKECIEQNTENLLFFKHYPMMRPIGKIINIQEDENGEKVATAILY